MRTALFTKIFDDRSLLEAIETTAAIGYDGIEIMCRAPHLSEAADEETLAEIREATKSHDLDIVALATYTGGYVDVEGTTREEILTELEIYLEFADALDVDIVRHGIGGPPERNADSTQYDEAASWYRKAADIAAGYDVNLVVELHADGMIETAETASMFTQSVNKPNVGVVHDAGNMFIAGADYGPTSIAQLGDRLLHVHIKDERRVEEASLPGAFSLKTEQGEEIFQHRLLNHGAVDHATVIDGLRAHGYTGYLSNECHRPADHPWTPEAIAAHELEAMKVLLAEGEIS